MKIDTKTINGFDSMTDDQKVAALLAVDIQETSSPDMSRYVLKTSMEKVMSENERLKKQLKEKQTAEEWAASEKDEENAKVLAERDELKRQNETLLHEKSISDYAAKFASMPGFDERLVKKAAEAAADGDFMKVLEYQKVANENHEKALKADLIKATPEPQGKDAGSQKITKERFDKMSYNELVKLHADNPSLYEEMMNGGE